MGVAAGLLNAALLLAGSGEGQVLQAAAQLIALSSAAAFLLAFSPPQSLRVMWRQPDERALWQAQGDLVAADTREAVVAAVLPHVARLVGGGAMFIDSGGEETAVGLEGPERARVRQRRGHGHAQRCRQQHPRDGVSELRGCEGERDEDGVAEAAGQCACCRCACGGENRPIVQMPQVPQAHADGEANDVAHGESSEEEQQQRVAVHGSVSSEEVPERTRDPERGANGPPAACLT